MIRDQQRRSAPPRTRVRAALCLAAVMMVVGVGESAIAQEAAPAFGTVPGDRVGERVLLLGNRVVTAALGRANATTPGALLIMERDEGGWRLARRVPVETGDAAAGDASLAARTSLIALGDFRFGDTVPGVGRVGLFDLAGNPPATASIASPAQRISTLFGAALALSSRWLVVGAPGDHVDGVRSGAAYVYEQQGATWRPDGRLTSPSPAFGAFLGQVGIAGDRILVGSSIEPGPEGSRGVIHVFERSPEGTWVRVQSLRGREAVRPADFATGFATHGDWLAVSGFEAEGAFIDLFRWQEDRYERSQHLLVPGLRQESRFGTAMQLGDRVLVAGAPYDARSVPASGGVYVFERETVEPSGAFRLAAFLGSPTAQAGDAFGRAVALDGNRLAVGAPGTDGTRGAVYLYDVTAVLRSPPAVFEALAPGILPASPASALAQDADGVLWIGGRDEILHYDGIAVRRTRSVPGDPKSLPGGVVLALHPTRDGSMWVGTEQGLARYDPATGAYRVYAVDTGGFPRTSFVALFEDRDGTIWTGTNGRLYRHAAAADRLVEITLADDEPRRRDESYISGIAQDRSGRLWVLAKNLWENRAALYRFDPLTNASVRFPLSEAWGQVGPMHIDGDDRLWLKAPAPVPLPAVAGTVVHPAQEVFVSTYWGFDTDGDGRLWIAHDRGYHVVDSSGRVTSAGTIVAGQGARAFLATRDGSFLVATARGVFRRVPSPAIAAAAERRSERVVLRSAEIIGSEGARMLRAPGLDAIELDADDLRLVLAVAIPVFTDPGRVGYRYRMRDYDPDWIDAAEAGAPSYTRLPPGSYRFEVEATVADPALSVAIEPLSLRVEVAAPLHERTWFRAVLLAVVAAIGYGAWEIRRRQREQVRQIRRQIASDLHDDLSTNLSGMALAGRMLERDPRLDEDQREAIDRIVRTADSMGGDLRDIVWLVDPGRDSAEDVASKMRRVARDLLGDLDCRLQIDGNALSEIDMAARRQLLLMYKECLHNVVRHASATRVDVSVRRIDGHLEMRVEDDGAGFDPRDAEGGHGLEGMRARAHRLGANLDIDAEHGRGTRIAITFQRPMR